MRSRTVIFSLLVHGAIAATLLGAAGKKIGRRPTSVALSEEKKKEKKKEAKPEPPKPPPPRQVARAPERKLASISKALPEPLAREVAPAPVATALTMGNDDGPGGIALPARGPAAKTAAAAPTKVASAVTDARRQRMREAVVGSADDGAPCNEEPTKPVPISKSPDIELTAAARAEGIEGRLILSLAIGVDGTVTSVRVTKSLSAEMDAAAEAAVKQWRFKPAAACGKPVAGTFNLGRTFELGD